jgi:hypothetical protein
MGMVEDRRISTKESCRSVGPIIGGSFLQKYEVPKTIEKNAMDVIDAVDAKDRIDRYMRGCKGKHHNMYIYIHVLFSRCCIYVYIYIVYIYI